MRPILPNLFFEVIYFRMGSSVGSAAGTPKLSTILPADQGSIVHGGSSDTFADNLRPGHTIAPTLSVGPRCHLAASILPWIIGSKRT
jgi:hypothetical protein